MAGRSTRVAGLILVVVVGAALPLAIHTWLAGGHVTPDQGWEHALAVTRHGTHSHGPADDGPSRGQAAARQASSAVSSGAGPAITTGGHAFTAEFWYAVLTALLMAAPPRGHRWQWPHRRPRPPAAPSGVPHPPPRPLLAAPA